MYVYETIDYPNRLDEVKDFPKEWNIVAAALYFPQLPKGITMAVLLSSEEYCIA